MNDGSGFGFGLGSAFSLFVIIIGGGLMYGCPQYNVYYSRLDGEARLARAESERQVQVRDAQGKLDAAGRLAQAEVERAKGVAEANKIIGSSLHDNEAYLKYLWINELGMNGKSPTVIYVPTEANIPILEAGRHIAK
jgi:regulator of protease activity HflC (stomatin/prohibitin superfamily)